MKEIELLDGAVANERRNRIAMLNDHFRMTGVGGKIMLTQGVTSLGEGMVANIITTMQQYTDWSKDNDPYGEHDFGIIKLDDSQKVYFKIDYYDERLEFGSDDPADPEKTTRVLTLMLAEEY